MLRIVKKLYKFDKIKAEHENITLPNFKAEIIHFFSEKDIKVKVDSSRNTLYVDVKSDSRIPITVLYQFCKKFDCEFDTNNDERYIFNYDFDEDIL